MKPAASAAALLILAAAPGISHRLDEYLQGTIVSIDKHRLNAEIALTPGVAVFPFVIGAIDTDGDGSITATEQRAYASRVLGDLSLRIDGHSLRPRLTSMNFPPLEEMREGRGEIRLTFSAELPAGGRNRRLVFENRHESRIAAYQVNCLVPGDADIRVAAQNRNYTQSSYELDYEQAGASDGLFPVLTSESGGAVALFALACFLAVRMARLARIAGLN